MAKMSAGKRASLPNSSFAGPNRSFPVNDVDHAKAAIMDSGSAPDPAAVRSKARAALSRMGASSTGSDTAKAMPSGKHPSILRGGDLEMRDHKMPSKGQ